MSTAPDLREVSVEEFLARSREDREFYFRNAIKIRPKDARTLVPFVMRPAQKRIMDAIDARRAVSQAVAPPRSPSVSRA